MRRRFSNGMFYDQIFLQRLARFGALAENVYFAVGLVFLGWSPAIVLFGYILDFMVGEVFTFFSFLKRPGPYFKAVAMQAVKVFAFSLTYWIFWFFATARGDLGEWPAAAVAKSILIVVIVRHVLVFIKNWRNYPRQSALKTATLGSHHMAVTHFSIMLIFFCLFLDQERRFANADRYAAMALVIVRLLADLFLKEPQDAT